MTDAERTTGEAKNTKVVWKFLVYPGEGSMYAPEGAEVLYATVQYGQAVVYALCDPTALRTHRRVLVVPTGGEFDSMGLRSAGLLCFEGGALMLHVFVSHD